MKHKVMIGLIITSVVLNVLLVATVAGVMIFKGDVVGFALTHSTITKDKMNDYNSYVSNYGQSPKE